MSSSSNDVDLMTCRGCGATNRVPHSKMAQGQRPICGRCKAPLGESGPIVASDANFASTIAASPLPVLLDLWAPWCGPCRTVGPIVDQLAAELAGRVRVAKLNIDDNPATAARFGVQSIPTLLILRGGKEIGRIVGAVPKAEILARLNAAI